MSSNALKSFREPVSEMACVAAFFAAFWSRSLDNSDGK